MIDRVFGADTTTKEVYEKGAKDVALSVLAGKNGIKSPRLIKTIYCDYLICGVGGELLNHPLVYTQTQTQIQTQIQTQTHLHLSLMFAM